MIRSEISRKEANANMITLCQYWAAFGKMLPASVENRPSASTALIYNGNYICQVWCPYISSDLDYRHIIIHERCMHILIRSYYIYR